MKTRLLFTIFINCCLSAAFAQTPQKGFDAKRKTAAATLSTLITELPRAEMVPLPKDRAGSPVVGRAITRPLSLTAPNLRVVRDTVTGRPVYIENRRTTQSTTNPNARVSATATTYTFLKQVGELLQISDPENNFTVRKTETDELAQMHVWLKQTYKGVPIYGAELVAHLTNGEVTVLNGHSQPTPTDLNTRPKLTLKQATTYAFQDVGKETVIRSLSENTPQLKRAEGELCLYPMPDNSMRLAYKLTIRPNFMNRWQYMIDAQTGAVLHKNSSAHNVDGKKLATARDLNGVSRTVNTYLKGSTYYLIDAAQPMFNTNSAIPTNPLGTIVTKDWLNKPNITSAKPVSVTSADNKSWTLTAISAHYNASVTYNYYLTTHKRNSIDGKGGTITSCINVADEKGGGWDQAQWNGDAGIMIYGNSKLLKPFAGALDVAAHEMTHGVIQHSVAGGDGLLYETQSGAINESFADIFACMVDRDDWTLGEDVVVKDYYPSGALRDLSNPNQRGKDKDPNGYQPKTMSEYLPSSPPYTRDGNDYGYVHRNSGIPNYAFYLFATNSNVGKDKAEKVYYRALTLGGLAPKATFNDLRLVVVKAADDLYGKSAPTVVTAAQSAFDAVGIFDPSAPASTTISTPVAQGPDLMLLSDTKSTGFYSTTVATTGQAMFDPKSKLGLRHRPSVTDDGQVAFYVTSDKRIRYVNLTGEPKETVFLGDTIWDNVAISKDGTKLAFLKAAPEKSVYVYSLTNKKLQVFTLYNPTNEGVGADDVKYADSFDWDPAGEYLVYDAYNESSNGDGDPIKYWDVGLLHVWDESTGDFAEGNINKIIHNLDVGESIGNPSFSKNSPNILAFDYYATATDSTDEAYSVLAVDLNTGTVGRIYENNTVGYPSYSRLDDRIAFGTVNKAGGTDIAAVKVSADKVTRTNLVRQTMYNNAQWPVWYTQATRVIPTRSNQTITFASLTNRTLSQTGFSLSATASSSLSVGFSVVSGPAELVGNKVKLTGLGSVTIVAYQDGNSQFYAATPVMRSFSVVASSGGRLEPTTPLADAVTLYPNPTGSNLTIELSNGQLIKQLTLHTLSGMAVLSRVNTTKTDKVTLDLTNLHTGMYLLTIQTPQGILTRKIIRE